MNTDEYKTFKDEVYHLSRLTNALDDAVRNKRPKAIFDYLDASTAAVAKVNAMVGMLSVDEQLTDVDADD